MDHHEKVCLHSITLEDGVANCSHSPDVEFCAYAIPHPSEDKMNLRIQTYGKYWHMISIFYSQR